MENAVEIIPNQPTILSKEQYAFNKKLADIKLLQADLKHITEGLPKAIHQLQELLIPFEALKLQLATERIVAIDDYSHQIKFTKKQTEVLADYLIEEIEKIFEKSEEKDEKLLEIFNIYAAMSFEEYETELTKQEKIMSADILKNMFGVEVEFNEDKSMEDILSEAQGKIFEKMGSDKERQEQNQRNRKNTKSQLKQEENQKAADELKKKSIREIYSEMIKIFHPDTEQDEERKVEKEEISKRLTEAYKKNDIFTLLKIETDYLQFDSERISRLSANKLKVYNDILTSQKMKLEQELWLLKEKNNFIYRGMLYKNSKPKSFLNKQKRQMEEVCQDIKKQTIQLRSFDPELKKHLLLFMETQLFESKLSQNPFTAGFPF